MQDAAQIRNDLFVKKIVHARTSNLCNVLCWNLSRHRFSIDLDDGQTIVFRQQAIVYALEIVNTCEKLHSANITPIVRTRTIVSFNEDMCI